MEIWAIFHVPDVAPTRFTIRTKTTPVRIDIMASAQIKAQQLKEAMQKRKNTVLVKNAAQSSTKSEAKEESKKVSDAKSVSVTSTTTTSRVAAQETGTSSDQV